MNTLSTWHVIIGILLAIGPSLLILSARSPLARRPYAIRSVGGLLAVAVGYGLTAAFSPLPMWLGGLVILVWFSYFLAQLKWAARRCLDIGRSKWWALLLYVPAVNGAMFVALLFVPSGPRAQAIGPSDTIE